MTRIIFDIETAPLPDEQLEKVMPKFEAPSNWKDPIKIEASIAEQRAEWKEKAALSALTGRVCAIGLVVEPQHGDRQTKILVAEEPLEESVMLAEFWDQYRRPSLSVGQWVGFNSHSFDLPFLVRRSWAVCVPVPAGLRSQGRYWNPRFVDLCDVWQMGDRMASGNLDNISRSLGFEGKNGNGADFHKLLKTDRPAAIEYLRRDLYITAKVARVLLGDVVAI